MKMSFKLAAAAAILLAGASNAEAKTTAKSAAPAKASAASAVDRIGGKPNLNGIWQAMNTADYNLEPHDAAEAPAASRQWGALAAIPPGLGVVEGGTIPYKPEALKLRDENRANAPMNDPEAACYLPGIPRATYINMPMQIVQASDGDILIVYQYAAANRVIHMQKVEVPPIDTWMGTSYGEWEGNTLKVVTLAQNPGDVIMPGGETKPGVTWIDRSGNYLTGSATVTERFTMVDKNHIDYEATIDDPDTFTKPWKISMPLYRHMEKNAEILDFRCVPFSEMLLYGDLLEDKGAGK